MSAPEPETSVGVTFGDLLLVRLFGVCAHASEHLRFCRYLGNISWDIGVRNVWRVFVFASGPVLAGHGCAMDAVFRHPRLLTASVLDLCVPVASPTVGRKQFRPISWHCGSGAAPVRMLIRQVVDVHPLRAPRGAAWFTSTSLKLCASPAARPRPQSACVRRRPFLRPYARKRIVYLTVWDLGREGCSRGVRCSLPNLPPREVRCQSFFSSKLE